MAATSLVIANSALSLVGARKITSLADPSKEARECNANHDLCRRAVLREHTWNFALKRDTLVLKDVTNAISSGGLIRLTIANHGFTTGDYITVNGVQGTTEANGQWTITVISSATFTLDGSTFTNTYVSDGKVGLSP